MIYSSLRLVKVLYIEPLDDLHRNAHVLEHLTKPLQQLGFIVDFTVIRDQLFAFEQLNRVNYDIFMVHDDAGPLRPMQFSHALKALRSSTTTPVVLIQDSISMTEETLAHFTSILIKPVTQQDICHIISKNLTAENSSPSIVGKESISNLGDDGSRDIADAENKHLARQFSPQANTPHLYPPCPPSPAHAAVGIMKEDENEEMDATILARVLQLTTADVQHAATAITLLNVSTEPLRIDHDHNCGGGEST